jgi:DNA sulfur modification protein DndB
VNSAKAADRGLLRGSYEFPALQGKMGSRKFYVVLFPLSIVPTIIASPRGAELPPEVRAQRKLNERRIPDITRYILDNEDGWLFSSLTASFNEKADFQPINESDPDIGVLRLPVTTRLLINDGQHRRAAIERALEEDPTLGSQTISVVLFPSESTERNQQMFSDLNRTVQKTPRSLNILYDHRDPLNQITLSVAEQVPLLFNRVEKEAPALAVRSAKFITVSSLYDMLGEFLGSLPAHLPERDIQRLEDESVAFLNELTSSLPQWQEIAEGHMRPAEVRMEFIDAHAVFFFAIGGAGHFMREHEVMEKLSGLRKIDWRRTNVEWQGICMLGPDIVTRRQTRTALRQQILFEVGLVPSPPRRVLEIGGPDDDD